MTYSATLIFKNNCRRILANQKYYKREVSANAHKKFLDIVHGEACRPAAYLYGKKHVCVCVSPHFI